MIINDLYYLYVNLVLIVDTRGFDAIGIAIGSVIGVAITLFFCIGIWIFKKR
jgi:hypothetical protein